MDNCFVNGERGYRNQVRGIFSWWPVIVYRGKPWPKEVPVLSAGNFHAVRPDGTWLRDSPDKRRLDEWMRGFPFDKMYRVDEALRQAIKEITGRGIGGRYRVWMWGHKQDGATKAKVWNRAMEILGYTEHGT